MENKKRASNSILLGILLIVIGIFAFIQQMLFIIRVFDIIGGVFLVHGVSNLYQYFIHNKQKLDLPMTILTMLTGGFLLLYPDIPVYLSTIIFAIYITLHGIMRFLVYWNYKENKVTGRLVFLILAIVLFVVGITVLLSPRVNTNQVIQVVAIYAVLLGISNVKDGILMIVPEVKQDVLRRKIRISLPIFITALLPKIMMEYFNDRVAVKSSNKVKVIEKDINLEIYIHASKKGYGQVGHCDICIDGEIISYGNYDYYSTKLFEMIGDGVIIVSKKDTYLPFCIKDSKKTIFGYGLHLNPIQLRAVRKAIANMRTQSYEWFPPSYFDSAQKKDYASRVYLETGAHFYKLKKGRFKKYFVLGSNCVLLVEYLIGRIGQDIITMNGIITPGRYQEYLESEYYKKDSQVKTRNIYNETTIVHK